MRAVRAHRGVEHSHESESNPPPSEKVQVRLLFGFPVLKIEEHPTIRFRNREGFCLASPGNYLIRKLNLALSQNP